MFDLHIPITYCKTRSINNDETINISLCTSSNEPPCTSFNTKPTANSAYIIAKASNSSKTTGTVSTEVLTKLLNRHILTSQSANVLSHTKGPAKDPERIRSKTLHGLLTLKDEKHKYKKEAGY